MLKKLAVVGIFFIFFCSLFVGIDRFVHRKSFLHSLSNMSSSYQHSPEWELPALNAEEKQDLDHILKQKFTFFAKGSQAYVFISEDQKYILKFLNQHKLKPRTWLAYIPLSFNPYYKQLGLTKKICRETFKSCKIAYLNFKEETGLIYVHLNSSKDLNKKVVIYDKNGDPHSVNLDKTSFFVQNRAQMIYLRISELMRAGDIEQAKNIITSVFSLIDYLGKKGVVDNDPVLGRNFGLINDKAVQIDIGTMHIDPHSAETLGYKDHVPHITHGFQTWLEKNYPELLPHFQEKLSDLLH